MPPDDMQPLLDMSLADAVAAGDAQLSELRALYERVRGLERMKSTLLDIAAHDLRNPIGAIRNLTELMLGQENMPAERRIAMLRDILTAASNAARIIDDLPVLQRIDRSERDVTFRSIEVGALLRSAVQQISPGADSRRPVGCRSAGRTPLTCHKGRFASAESGRCRAAGGCAAHATPACTVWLSQGKDTACASLRTGRRRAGSATCLRDRGGTGYDTPCGPMCRSPEPRRRAMDIVITLRAAV